MLVDDNPGDIHLTQEAFRECGLQAHFVVAMQGEEAMQILSRTGVHAESPIPDFILLDLNLPKVDGREVLAHIKRSETLRRIPTVILTTSNRRQDIEYCYSLFANTYIVKPVQWDQFVILVRTLCQYWFNTASLPSA